MIGQTSLLINDFIQAARLAGLVLHPEEIRHEALPCPHRPSALPAGLQAVYVFSLPSPALTVLKVGKAGPKTAARFLSQHYNPGSAPSNLAKSMLGDTGFWTEIKTPPPDEYHIGEWIKKYVDRDNFFLSIQKGSLALSSLEVFLQCRLQPRYEGKSSL